MGDDIEVQLRRCCLPNGWGHFWFQADARSQGLWMNTQAKELLGYGIKDDCFYGPILIAPDEYAPASANKQ